MDDKGIILIFRNPIFVVGGQYVAISPGGSETFLSDGDQILFTQSAIVLENLVSKFLFSKAAEAGGGKTEETDQK